MQFTKTQTPTLTKVLNVVLDILMFIVPILELTDVMSFIAPAYLPYYMLSTVVLRRLARVLEDYLKTKIEITGIVSSDPPNAVVEVEVSK